MPSHGRNDPWIGRTFGNVVIQAPLGAGGMATVYKGLHKAFAKEVAVKILPPRHDQAGESLAKRFLREGRTTARIQHENVVQVMDSGVQDGVAYLVMELVDGQSLGSRLDDVSRLAEDEVLRLAEGIVRGLKAVHAQGVVHRDIKPDNILITREGVPKVADLGLARQLDDPELNRLTATGMVVGTPLYVSPEAIRDTKNAGPASDVYSLGATLFHMLTGKPPFLGKTPFDVMRAHLDQKPPHVHELAPEVSKSTAGLVELCLAKDPAERPTLDQMLAVLKKDAQVHGGRGMITGLVVAAVVLVAGAAIAGWQVFNRQAGTTAPVADAALLSLTATVANSEIAIDGDVWQPLPSTPLRLAPGTHTVTVRAIDDGLRLAWTDSLTVAAGEVLKRDAALAPVPAEARVTAEGDGLVLRRGEVLGLDAMILLPYEGRWPLARWNGINCWYAVVEVRAGRPVDKPVWTSVPSGFPPADAFLRNRHHGQRIRPHHICCQQEVDWLIRRDPSLKPVGWELGLPSDHARRLAVQLVTVADQTFRKQGYRLPGEDESRDLSSQLESGLWTVGASGAISPTPGCSPAEALLVLVPL